VPIFCIISILIRIDSHSPWQKGANVCGIPPHGKTVKIMQLLQIDYVKLRKDYNFLLEIRLFFCHLHINGIVYTIYWVSDSNRIDEAMR
jgi:hypothetical protein